MALSKTNLQLCQDYSREANFATLSSVPTTTLLQAGRLLQCVENIRQSWQDIQNRYPNWRWMRVGFTVDTAASDRSYAFGDCTDDLTSNPIDRFSHWRVNDADDPPKTYLVSAGVGTERWLIWVPWDYFNRVYGRGTQNDGPPSHISVDPQNNLVLGPTPDDIYRVTGYYQRSPQDFVADADVPDMPEQFHNLIWSYALQNYGMNHAANHILVKAATLTKRRMRQLEANQLPDLVIGEPMA
jgi:hypothetical protein